MLDLKAKLAAAGLVTREDIDRANAPRPDRGNRGSRGGRGGRGKGQAAAEAPRERPGLDLAALQAAGKGERYEAIRRAVDRQRLDSAGVIPSEGAEPFHFTTEAGSVSRIFAEAPLRRRLEEGSAGIVAYMSNHGLAHAAVPAPLARV
ncbi:MAG: hypothetical protein KC420_15520, partial [Myxococcales bacterium]|nr:hypothetical protein [Myxococcales bacterium]